MEVINGKITQADLNEAMNELFELEIEKGNPKLTPDKLKNINKQINDIYTKFPELKEE